ncbi:hypothetical protein MJI47_27285, partial [Salmonella enterica subsp. enterica serovar Kentucky]|nr:hypothetical protein [Salmonella enterica subsp. enterica serovar Kentucky]
VEREACPMHLAPTSSTVNTLMMGDALAMAVMQARGFNEEDFAPGILRPARTPSSAVITSRELESIMRPATASGEKPPKITECTAP